jgi:hypothetical protein
MNEPTGLPCVGDVFPTRVWRRASQRALDAIRSKGDRQVVLVQGYEWPGAQRWPANHPASWIDDPDNNFRYEAHHYWDRDNSGAHRHGYAEEVTNARQRGY